MQLCDYYSASILFSSLSLSLSLSLSQNFVVRKTHVKIQNCSCVKFHHTEDYIVFYAVSAILTNWRPPDNKWRPLDNKWRPPHNKWQPPDKIFSLPGTIRLPYRSDWLHNPAQVIKNRLTSYVPLLDAAHSGVQQIEIQRPKPAKYNMHMLENQLKANL